MKLQVWSHLVKVRLFIVVGMGCLLIAWLRFRWVFLSTPRVLNYPPIWNEMVLRHFGARVGSNGYLAPPIIISNAYRDYKNLAIGDRCVLNGLNFLDLKSSIVLEDGVSLGPGVIINTHNRFNHNPYLETVLAHHCDERGVTIGKRSGIKAGALITMGVTIGHDSVVAGGAVVNRDVEPKTFVSGIPAKVKQRLDEIGQETSNRKK